MTEDEALAFAWKQYEAEFERCSPFLQAALDRSLIKTHELEHVWDAVKSGKAVLWPLPNSAVVTRIDDCPTGVRLLTQWLAGGDLDEIRNLEPAVHDYARAQGCTWATINGREGWVKKLDGYKRASAVFVKELT